MIIAGLLISLFGASSFFCTKFADPYIITKYPVMLAGLLVSLFGLWRNRAEQKRCHTILSLPIALMTLVMGITVATSVDIHTSIVGERAQQLCSLMAWLTCLGAFEVSLQASHNNRGGQPIMAVLMWSCLPMLIYGLMQYGHWDPFVKFALPSGDRVFSSQGSPVFLGALLAMLLPVGMRYALDEYDGDNSVLALIFLCLAAPVLYFTGTRAAIIGGLLGGFVFAAMDGALPIRFKWASLVVLVTFAASMAACSWSWTKSDMMRIELWRNSLALFWQHPWLGSGPDTFFITFRSVINPAWLYGYSSDTIAQGHAHNDVLQVMTTMGGAGLLAYGVLLLSVLGLIANAWRNPISRPDAAMLGGSAVALFFVAKFNPVPVSALFMFAVMLGTLQQGSDEEITRWHLSGVGFTVITALIMAVPSLMAELELRRSYMALNRHDPIAAANHVYKAHEWAPHQLYYSFKAVDQLRMVSPYGGAAWSKQIVQMAHEVALDAVKDHPADSHAYQALASTFALKGAMGDPDGYRSALRVLHAGHDLAPTFTPLIRERMVIARQIGDVKEFNEADKEMVKIERIMRRG